MTCSCGKPALIVEDGVGRCAKSALGDALLHARWAVLTTLCSNGDCDRDCESL